MTIDDIALGRYDHHKNIPDFFEFARLVRVYRLHDFVKSRGNGLTHRDPGTFGVCVSSDNLNISHSPLNRH